MIPIIIFKRNFSSKKLQPFYSILKVKVNSTPEEIRQSYLKLSRIYHPDNLQTGDGKKFIRIKDAYDKIMSEFPSISKEYSDNDFGLTHRAYIDYIKRNPRVSMPLPPVEGGRCSEELYSKVNYKRSLIDKLASKLIK